MPITWRTDGSVQSSGFKICMAGPPSPPECAAILAEARADPACDTDGAGSSGCPLECALSHLSSMASCESNFPAEGMGLRSACNMVIDALVDQDMGSALGSCAFAGDGECDEPSQCMVGTDPDCAAEPRSSNVCTADAACPPSTGLSAERGAWTEMLYYDADINLELRVVGIINSVGASQHGSSVVRVSGAGRSDVDGEYVPLLAKHTEIIGSEVFARQESSGQNTGMAMFVSHQDSGDRVWVLADLGPTLDDVDAEWLYSVESQGSLPPPNGWTSDNGEGPAPGVYISATGVRTCVDGLLNLVVLIDRCHSQSCAGLSNSDDGIDHHEVLGIVDADGEPVSGQFTGAKRLQLLPPGSAGRWVQLDSDMRPLNGTSAEDPEPAMNRGETLAQFVSSSMAAFPADHYMLEMMDHGSAWMGGWGDADNYNIIAALGEVCPDEFAACETADGCIEYLTTVLSGEPSDPSGTAESAVFQALMECADNVEIRPPSLEVQMISGALETALGDQKLDIISFYACLMASQKVAAALAPHTHYMIASELTIRAAADPADYFNHQAHVPYAEGSVSTPEEYATRIVDAFGDCGAVSAMQTISLIGLDLYPAFSEAMADVAVILTAAVATSIEDERIITALQVVNDLDSDYEDDTMGVFGADVGAFLSRWATVLDDRSSDQAAAAATAARTAHDRYETMVLHERHSMNNRDAYTGIHIMFPGSLASSSHDHQYTNLYRATPVVEVDQLDVAWHAFIDALFVALTPHPHIVTNGGTIDVSGGYDNNAALSWTLTCTDPTASSTLSFSSFDTESSCDKVSVYDGSSSSSDRLIHASGSSTPSTIHGSGSDLFMTFSTDGSVTRDGFVAEFSCTPGGGGSTDRGACAGSESIADGGAINQTGGYANGMDCTWTITCSDSSTVPTVSFTSFDLEHNFDRVQVYDGASSDSTELMSASGGALPAPVHGSGQKLFIEFHTDSSVTHDGFVAVASCAGHATPPSGGGPPADACNGGVIWDSGTIDQGRYDDNEDCTWTLRCSDDGAGPTLRFSRFATESNFDFVTVSDEDATLLRVSGHSIPSDVRGTNTWMTVHFTTDSSEVDDGFTASFTCADDDTSSERCSATSCNSCIQTTYSCGIMFTDTCYCEMKSCGTCDTGSFLKGASSPVTEQCTSCGSAGTGAGYTWATQLPDSAEEKSLATFELTNPTLHNDGDGHVHVNAEVPNSVITARMWTGVLDAYATSGIHASGVDVLWLLDAKGGTTETDTSVVGTWWTSVQSATISFDGETDTTDVSGEWDGLSEVLSQTQPGAAPDRSAFVFSSARYVEKYHASEGKEVLVTSFKVIYYELEPEYVPRNGAGGVFATLRAGYTRDDNGSFTLLSKTLWTKLDETIEKDIPLDAGGCIVPILVGSKTVADDKPVGDPQMYLFDTASTAMAWSPSLKLTREPVTEALCDDGHALVSTGEVMMLQAEDVSGETDSYVGVFHDGVLDSPSSFGSQGCVELLDRGDGCPLVTAFRVTVLVATIAALIAVYCCVKRCRGGDGTCSSYSGAIDRNTSKLRGLSGDFSKLESDESKAESGIAAAQSPKEQQPMLAGGATDVVEVP